jgi:hypothetical protein
MNSQSLSLPLSIGLLFPGACENQAKEAELIVYDDMALPVIGRV